MATPIVYLTVAEMGRLYALGRHVVELRATLQNSPPMVGGRTEWRLCAICTTTPNSLVDMACANDARSDGLHENLLAPFVENVLLAPNS